MPTHYETTVPGRPRFAPLRGVADADIAIVGGGFAGLASAYGLMARDRGAGCVLLEAESIGHGASGRNGGFVFGGFSLDNAALLARHGRDEARALYALTQAAVDRIRERIARHAIDCDAVHAGVLLADWFRDPRALREVQRLMREEFGVDWRWVERDELRALLASGRYHAALHEANAFHFNPLKYALGIARALHEGGVRLHEGTRVTAIRRVDGGWRIDAAGGRVHCRDIVVCCGGYLGRLVPALARAVLSIATYVMVTEPLGVRLRDAIRTDAAVYDTRFAFDYYHALPDTRLLWGGRISVRDRSPAEVQRLLMRDLLRVYPQLAGTKVEHAWSGLMSYARHKMPQIGRLPDGRWYAMGFGGHGVAPTTVAGELLAAAITGEADIPQALAPYGLAPTYGPFGLVAAQSTYWWHQASDALRARR